MRSGSTTLRAPPLERKRELKHPPEILQAGVLVADETSRLYRGVQKSFWVE